MIVKCNALLMRPFIGYDGLVMRKTITNDYDSSVKFIFKTCFGIILRELV